MIPGIPDCFRNQRKKIKKWYANIIFMNIGTDIKKTAWLNTIEHLKGNHNDCLIHKYTAFVWDIGIQYDEAAQKLFDNLKKKDE